VAGLFTVNAIVSACAPTVRVGPARQESPWTAYLGTPRHDAAARETLNDDPRPVWHVAVGRAIRGSPALGEAVVAALVIPDSFRVTREGRVIEKTPGYKKIAVRGVPGGGTVEEKLAQELVEALCLDDANLQALNELAGRCEHVYGPGRDIEWALADGKIYLLQCRAITIGGK